MGTIWEQIANNPRTTLEQPRNSLWPTRERPGTTKEHLGNVTKVPQERGIGLQLPARARIMTAAGDVLPPGNKHGTTIEQPWNNRGTTMEQGFARGDTDET